VGALVIGLGVASWVVGVVAGRASERVAAQRIGEARTVWEPPLRRWLALDEQAVLTDDQVEAWLRYQRMGVRKAVAERWSAAGYSPGIAAAAMGRRITIGQVDELARMMRTEGVWDGEDRDELTRIIAWHVEPGGPSAVHYPVLARWLQVPTGQLQEAIRGTVATAAQRWPGVPEKHQVRVAVEGLLHDLTVLATR
jgi:hypothetical protein